MQKKSISGGVALLLLALLPLSVIMQGLVLSRLWAWFIAPVFELPYLTIPVAIGLAMTVRFITNQTTPKRDDDDTVTTFIVFAVVYPLMALLMGWIVTLFM